MNSEYLVGKLIDNRYEIHEIIGRGGMATVYRAKCRVLNRFVAIKVLKPSLKQDAEVIRRFNTESRAAAKLSHPNIVQVFDVGDSHGLDYIVMELVDGVTLSDYIQKNGPLSWEKACDYALQIASALSCAHANHVIHRDIKPHNILVGRDGIVKVADFGIAQAATNDTMVAGKGGMGSIRYSSPEQVRGGFTDEQSDLYSLGVVLYEMLTGKVPFDGENPVSIALMKIEKEPTDCKVYNSYIPERIAKFTMKAIARDRHARFQSAEEMIAALEGFIGSGARGKDDISGTGGNKKKMDKATKYIIYAIAGVIAMFIGTYAFMSSGTQEYEVPDLTNMTVEEAEDALRRTNLRLDGNIKYEESEDVEKGLVINQNPGISQFVKKGRKIKITVSSGTSEGEIETVKVIDVENLEKEKAVAKLEDEGFKCDVVEEYSETIQYGYVIRQSPSPYTILEKGSKVTIYVSADVEPPVDRKTKVPRLVGYTASQATALLEQAGLSLGTVLSEESTEEAGKIITQLPSDGTEVERGSTVSVVVSSGSSTPEPTQDTTPTPTVPPVHTQSPIQTPTPGHNPTQAPIDPVTPSVKEKILTINIPDSANDVVTVEVVVGGVKTYSRKHNKSEVTVDIPVKATEDTAVQVYIDEKLVVNKVINF